MADPRELGARRGYQQYCGLAKALDLLGERWTLLVIRELLLGPRRWTQLLDHLPGMPTNLLAKRLAALQSAGIVERLSSPAGDPDAGRKSWYQLSEVGRALEPAVMELARWGGRFMADGPSAEDRVELGWALLSSKRRYSGRDPSPAPAFVLELGAVDPDGVQQRFQLRFEPSYLDVREGAPWPAAIVVDGELAAVFEWWFGGVAGRRLVRAGRLAASGDEAGLIGALTGFDGVRW